MPTCKGLRKEVVECLMVSDCVLTNKRNVKECYDLGVNESSEVTEKCQKLIKSHRICIKGLLDKRNRIVGFKGY